MRFFSYEIYFWFNNAIKKSKILPRFCIGVEICEDEYPHKEIAKWYQITCWRFTIDVVKYHNDNK